MTEVTRSAVTVRAGRATGSRSRGSRTRRRDLARVRAAVILLLLIGGGALAVWLTLRADERSHPAAPPGCGGTAPAEAAVRIRVLNATTRTGLAASVATALRGRGFAVTGIGNDPASVPGAALLRYGPHGLVAARRLLAVVPGAARRPDRRSGTDIDLVLGNRFTRLAPPVPAPSPSPSRCRASATPTPSPRRG